MLCSREALRSQLEQEANMAGEAERQVKELEGQLELLFKEKE